MTREAWDVAADWSEVDEMSKGAWDVGGDWCERATPASPATKERECSFEQVSSSLALLFVASLLVLGVVACLDPTPVPSASRLLPPPSVTYWVPETGPNGGRRVMQPALLESQARSKAGARTFR